MIAAFQASADSRVGCSLTGGGVALGCSPFLLRIRVGHVPNGRLDGGGVAPRAAVLSRRALPTAEAVGWCWAWALEPTKDLRNRRGAPSPDAAKRFAR